MIYKIINFGFELGRKTLFVSAVKLIYASWASRAFCHSKMLELKYIFWINWILCFPLCLTSCAVSKGDIIIIYQRPNNPPFHPFSLSLSSLNQSSISTPDTKLIEDLLTLDLSHIELNNPPSTTDTPTSTPQRQRQRQRQRPTTASTLECITQRLQQYQQLQPQPLD